MVRAHEPENQNVFVTDTPLSITSRPYPARPALMRRLNQPPFVGSPLQPGILKRGELEIAALQTGGPSAIWQCPSAMVVEQLLLRTHPILPCLVVRLAMAPQSESSPMQLV
jgi:hypothetical protein